LIFTIRSAQKKWPRRRPSTISRFRPGSPEREGVSVFFKDAENKVFHTYSTYARGIEMVNLDYRYLDLVPKGRDEGGRGPFWVRHHDEYGG